MKAQGVVRGFAQSPEPELVQDIALVLLLVYFVQPPTTTLPPTPVPAGFLRGRSALADGVSRGSTAMLLRCDALVALAERVSWGSANSGSNGSGSHRGCRRTWARRRRGCCSRRRTCALLQRRQRSFELTCHAIVPVRGGCWLLVLATRTRQSGCGG